VAEQNAGLAVGHRKSSRASRATTLTFTAAAWGRSYVRLHVVASKPELIRLLRLTALDRVFRVHPTREAALESLRQQSRTSSRPADEASRRR
jgi:hypothetical protein